MANLEEADAEDEMPRNDAGSSELAVAPLQATVAEPGTATTTVGVPATEKRSQAVQTVDEPVTEKHVTDADPGTGQDLDNAPEQQEDSDEEDTGHSVYFFGDMIEDDP